jgi:hypothetical protein
MSNVVELPLAVEMAGRESTHLRRLSRVLMVLFTVFVAAQILWMLAAAVVTIWFADHVLVGAKGAFLFSGTPPFWKGTVLYSTQSAVTRLAGMIDIVMAMLPILLAFWNLRGLFALYSRGIVFARENAAHLKRVGLWLVVYPFAKVLANLIFQAAGGTDKAWFHMELIYALVAGLIVFVIAQVMEFGHEIEQEKDSFV